MAPGRVRSNVNGDVRVFDRVARPCDLVIPSAKPSKLAAGLDRAERAERDVRRIADVAGGSGRGVRTVHAPERFVVDAAPECSDGPVTTAWTRPRASREPGEPSPSRSESPV